MKITLLGDSIRLIGYGTRVPELLGDDFEVYQPTDNCRFTKYLLRGLFDWKNKMQGSRIVHFNSGLWDTCNVFGDGSFTPKEHYFDDIMRIADILLESYDKVIFATTTPVTAKNSNNKNIDIEAYNRLVVPALEEKGVIINDLYTPVAADIDKYICEDDIHLSAEGIELCANQVAKIIKEVSSQLKE